MYETSHLWTQLCSKLLFESRDNCTKHYTQHIMQLSHKGKLSLHMLVVWPNLQWSSRTVCGNKDLWIEHVTTIFFSVAKIETKWLHLKQGCCKMNDWPKTTFFELSFSLQFSGNEDFLSLVFKRSVLLFQLCDSLFSREGRTERKIPSVTFSCSKSKKTGKRFC